MCKINYIGEVRTDTDHYEKHITNEKRPADFKPTFEVAAQMDWDAEEWNYVFHWVPVGKLAERRVTYTIPDVADIYIYTNMKEAEIRELQITRKLNLIEYTKPFKTDVIKQHWDTEKKQEKISITDEHVFGEPKTLELVVEGGDGPCLVDLDQAKAYAIPEGIEGVELAKYQEEKQIDLRVLINTDNHSAVRTVACSAYGLPKKYWDATPQACVRHFDDIRNGTVAEVPSRRTALWDKKTYAEQLDRVFLATTSDGSMVIYRIDRLDLSPDAGPAKATITVRKVVSDKQ